ncbi:gamma-glutamylcyclotransferase-like [Pollicipes pollicipes]|uniref:gamma-glutamylcyclotransferase-like n=1 Tax=Pollicipes pollicipes TaxID=41117 RepID=UPI001884F323|nr:gamma-glutamylcyclotransferase-like [Pollicipes pollicipes]
MCLQGFRLDFSHFSKRWQGAVATIVEDAEQHVWGVIWELDEQHRETLDNQEGVHQGIYRPLSVMAETPDGRRLACRSYQLAAPPGGDGRPSAVYKRVILLGATENALPDAYLRFLAALPDNGYSGDVDVGLDLGQT